MKRSNDRAHNSSFNTGASCLSPLQWEWLQTQVESAVSETSLWIKGVSCSSCGSPSQQDFGVLKVSASTRVAFVLCTNRPKLFGLSHYQDQADARVLHIHVHNLGHGCERKARAHDGCGHADSSSCSHCPEEDMETKHGVEVLNFCSRQAQSQQSASKLQDLGVRVLFSESKCSSGTASALEPDLLSTTHHC